MNLPQFATDQQQGTLTLEKADQAPTVEAREAYIKAYRAQEAAKFGPEFAEAQSEQNPWWSHYSSPIQQSNLVNRIRSKVLTPVTSRLYSTEVYYAIKSGVTTREAAYALQGGVDVKAPKPGSILYEVDQGN